ncbi:MAG: rod shape-determining protein RodA [Gammaproteobacteria bacterium]|jgi:rod shape determining protein RodA|nr:rod shape-determining protein RodA [Gammaproteobacteria bacterium]MBU2178795.1 rod shape-determining protein RodA [Gammaproteobacteria bacterium]MBU2225451.1 rod shape-determining protein RodA [Gammaproteobacteria bacterium]MBU2280855.1 rod shape-determining protein RodA [Gammaproteobacteria bacterium]MBU2426228.1 rod shape-determining protein RodA [Gammaproteobacteria bacterium]
MTSPEHQTIWQRWHIDLPLLAGLLVLIVVGLLTLYSADGQDLELIKGQSLKLIFATTVMLLLAQVHPQTYRRWAMPLFLVGLLLLVCVLLFGYTAKGATRWIDLGFTKFQPSELMKLAVPMAVAWYMAKHAMPAGYRDVSVGFMICLVPTLLIAKQPDLGTSILIAVSGIFVLFLSGMSWRIIGFIGVLIASFLPVLWNFLMHDYQRRRVLTLLDAERDPLGSGYHIIQSKIAIGSGGFEGKGWMHGTQSQLEFLPERHTDFIFAVFAEEMGLMGVACLLVLYFYIIGRGLVIASQAQDNFSRFLAGSITLTFFVYVFVNIGMVSGILPVVGVPLPLISFGGTSLVTLLAGFGILMSISTHKRMLANQ